MEPLPQHHGESAGGRAGLRALPDTDSPSASSGPLRCPAGRVGNSRDVEKLHLELVLQRILDEISKPFRGKPGLG